MGATLNEFTSLAARLNESRKAQDLMAAFPRTIQFDLKGESGPFYMTIEGGRMSIRTGVPAKTDLLVAGESNAFAEVVRGKLDVSHTLARGQIVIEKGKVSEMTLLNRILVTTERR